MPAFWALREGFSRPEYYHGIVVHLVEDVARRHVDRDESTRVRVRWRRAVWWECNVQDDDGLSGAGQDRVFIQR